MLHVATTPVSMRATTVYLVVSLKKRCKKGGKNRISLYFTDFEKYELLIVRQYG